MSVLGQKVTELNPLNSLQPSDAFLAIRGGVSYKIYGEKFASIDQLTFARNEYLTRIGKVQENVDASTNNVYASMRILSSSVERDFIRNTTGEQLSTTFFNLSSYAVTAFDDIRLNYARTTYVDTASANIVNWSTSTFLTKLSAQKSYVPLPGPQYINEAGKVLTWSTTASAWIPGPGLGVTNNVDLGPIGAIIWYAGSTAPDGYLLCDGQLVLKTTYSELWDAIGDTYGRPPGTGENYFKIPNLVDMGIIAEERPDSPTSIPINFYIKVSSSVRSALVSELSGYLKLSPQYIPSEEQYLKYYDGEWVPTALPPSVLPATAQLSSLLAWNGSRWIAGTPQVQSIYSQETIIVNNNSECIFTNIPTKAKKITLVITNLDITPNNGSLVKLRLGNNSVFVNSGYKNACQGVYANPYIRTSNGYYSYASNTTPDTDAFQLIVRADTLETREQFGGLDTIITLMRSQASLINNTSKWVCTHMGRVGASVIQGAGSVTLTNGTPTDVGIFSANPEVVITTGQLTLYWE